MKQWMRPLVAALLMIAAIAAGAYGGHGYWAVGRFIERTDNAYVRADSASIAPKVAGYVVELAVQDNQSVKAGDLLLRIDPADYEARRTQAAAALAAARARRASLDQERVFQNAVVRETEAALKAAGAEASRATRDRERADRLVRDRWTTEANHDVAVTTEIRAGAAVEQAQASLAAQQQRLQVMDAESIRLDAAVDQAAAQLRLAEIALNDTEIRAPIAGVVGNRHVETGHYARAGSPLLTIVPLDDVWVVANFKEVQLARLAPGQRVRVLIDTFGNREFGGRVDSVAPASGSEFSLLPPENATGNFVRVVQRIPVKIVLDTRDRAPTDLRPGMSAVVEVDTRSGALPGVVPKPLEKGSRDPHGHD